MGRIAATVILSAMFCAGCATSVPPSRTVDALATLQLKARAGLYPAEWAVPGDSHAAYLARLQEWAADEGIVVATAPISKKNLLGHVSHTAYAGWVVLINDSLPPNNRLYTLLHELGHVYGPPKLGMDAAEVLAEMVAAQVCEDVGLNVWPQTTAYLATYVPIDRQSAAVQLHSAAIDRVVVKLSKALKP
jgi:hypothetical protein